jgi:hypothetical protein
VPSCARLHDLDATAAAERLPHAFHAVVPQLTGDLEGVRFAAEEALKCLIAACLDDAAVAAAVNLAGAGMGASAGPPSAAAGVVASVAGALDPRTQDAWPSALSGAGSLSLALCSIPNTQFACLRLRKYASWPCNVHGL